MPAAKPPARAKLPARFEDLARCMPPRALQNDAEHAHAVAMIDRLMAAGRLTRGQAIYLDTLVQLAQAYEAAHHAIDVSDITGLQSLRHLLDENDMNASDLARLLGVHASMGSKILNGERSLTVVHLKILAIRFSVSPALFMD